MVEGWDGVVGKEEGGGFEGTEGVQGCREVEADHSCALAAWCLLMYLTCGLLGNC